jgi:hypothetical protein
MFHRAYKDIISRAKQEEEISQERKSIRVEIARGTALEHGELELRRLSLMKIEDRTRIVGPGLARLRVAHPLRNSTLQFACFILTTIGGLLVRRLE